MLPLQGDRGLRHNGTQIQDYRARTHERAALVRGAEFIPVQCSVQRGATKQNLGFRPAPIGGQQGAGLHRRFPCEVERSG